MADELDAKLAAIDDGAVVRPNADPHASAVTALLVSDWLLQPEILPKLGMEKQNIRDLRALSRKIRDAMDGLGGEYLDDGKPVPGEVVQRGHALRTQMLQKLEEGLPHEKEVIAWLDAIRLGQGIVDLVYDLRTLAELHREHDAPLSSKNLNVPTVVASARSAADSIEYALRAGERPEQTKHRLAIARAWTLFAPLYEKAAAAGRAVSAGEGEGRRFPPLGLIASYRRGRRRAVSLVPVAPTPPPSHLPQEPLEVMKVGPASAGQPPSPPSPSQRGAVLSAPYTSSGPQSAGPDSRRQPRHTVEIEMGFASDSNFYVGFTENLSVSGLFAATYNAKPIGTKIEVQLVLPTGEEMKIKGIVRWLRAASTEGWPGMGVQFLEVPPEYQATIEKFLSIREPLFYEV